MVAGNAQALGCAIEYANPVPGVILGREILIEGLVLVVAPPAEALGLLQELEGQFLAGLDASGGSGQNVLCLVCDDDVDVSGLDSSSSVIGAVSIIVALKRWRSNC